MIRTRVSGVLAVAFIGALLGAGCIIDSDDGHMGGSGGYGGYGGSPTGGTGGAGGTGGTGGSLCAMPAASAFTVLWTVETAGQQPTTCAAVGATSMDIDLVNMTTGEELHYTYPCTALGGTTCELPLGDYSVAMRLRNRVGDLMYEVVWDETQPAVASGLTDLGTVPFEATPDQYIRLSWAIERQVTLAQLTCAQANAATMRLDTGIARYEFPCTDQNGRTQTITPGDYTLTASLLDPSQNILSITPPKRVSIPAANPVDLGPVVFEVP